MARKVTYHKCAELACPANHKEGGWWNTEASNQGWFMQFNGDHWCPEHVPAWVGPWRIWAAKQKLNERNAMDTQAVSESPKSSKVTITIEVDDEVVTYEFPAAQHIEVTSEPKYVENTTHKGPIMAIDRVEFGIEFVALKDPTTGECMRAKRVISEVYVGN